MRCENHARMRMENLGVGNIDLPRHLVFYEDCTILPFSSYETNHSLSTIFQILIKIHPYLQRSKGCINSGINNAQLLWVPSQKPSQRRRPLQTPIYQPTTSDKIDPTVPDHVINMIFGTSSSASPSSVRDLTRLSHHNFRLRQTHPEVSNSHLPTTSFKISSAIISRNSQNARIAISS